MCEQQQANMNIGMDMYKDFKYLPSTHKSQMTQNNYIKQYKMHHLVLYLVM